MIDSYELLRDKIEADDTRERFSLPRQEYGVVTLHRPVNVDDRSTLTLLVEQLRSVALRLPLVFPIHPRTRKSLNQFKLGEKLRLARNLILTDPLGYIQFMNLVSQARLVITDSGGIQEETTYLNIPCLTLRDTTERPITLTQGTNRLVRPRDLSKTVDAILDGEWSSGQCPELWDGCTATRVLESLKKRVNVDSAT
jgi:UDP-N-acetylglucosamine 2-epimerase (non-hydrolysing)